VEPLVPLTEPKEATAVTLDQIVYHRRVLVLDQAAKEPVAVVCRRHGISRKTFYRWADRARRHGLAALMPKGRRRPSMPNVTPPEVVEVVLAEAIARPTLGARRLLEHLEERGVVLSASGVQKLLVRHGLGRRAQRLGVLASITAAEAGLVTRASAEGPFGFCHYASVPGQLVALDAFYVGRLKGVGTVWQLTAVDTATRWAVAELITTSKGVGATVAFVDRVRERLAAVGVELTGVLSDNGPEFTKAFSTAMAERAVTHHRTPPRSPNHNAVCERFQGIALDEFYRPAFHRQRFDRLADLDAQFQRWLERYNTRRRNHGDFMRGRTPLAVLNSHR